MIRARPSTSHGEDSSSTSGLPVDVLQFKNSRLLDTVFFSKRKKIPRWATITSGPITRLYAVSSAGLLTEKAVINWSNHEIKESGKPSVTVEIDGVVRSAEDFGRKRSGGQMNAKEVHKFETAGRQFQWSAKILDPFIHATSRLSGLDASYPQWECTTDIAKPTPAIRPSSSSSRLKALIRLPPKEEPRVRLATLLLPDGLSFRRDIGLTLYPDGKSYVFQLLLSVILLGSQKDDWKTSQSKATHQELQAMIAADAAGALPAYTPVREDGHTQDTRNELHPTVPTNSRWRWNSRDRQEVARDPTPSPRYEHS